MKSGSDEASTARARCPDVRKYASKRVFDGTRPLTADQVAKLRANYYRTQTTHDREVE